MKAFIYDTETTGLVDNRLRKPAHQAEVIEFYGCMIDLTTGQIDHEYDTLIKPRADVSDVITKITGITNTLLANEKPFVDVAPNIKQILEAAPMIIAHNASFDREIIDIEFDRLNDKINWPFTLCTVEQTIHLKGYRLSLGNLYELLFEEQFVEAHRAKKDVESLTRCCVELHRREII